MVNTLCSLLHTCTAPLQGNINSGHIHFQSRIWPFCFSLTEPQKGSIDTPSCSGGTLANERRLFPRRAQKEDSSQELEVGTHRLHLTKPVQPTSATTVNTGGSVESQLLRFNWNASSRYWEKGDKNFWDLWRFFPLFPPLSLGRHNILLTYSRLKTNDCARNVASTKAFVDWFKVNCLHSDVNATSLLVNKLLLREEMRKS